MEGRAARQSGPVPRPVAGSCEERNKLMAPGRPSNVFLPSGDSGRTGGLAGRTAGGSGTPESQAADSMTWIGSAGAQRLVSGFELRSSEQFYSGPSAPYA